MKEKDFDEIAILFCDKIQSEAEFSHDIAFGEIADYFKKCAKRDNIPFNKKRFLKICDGDEKILEELRKVRRKCA